LITIIINPVSGGAGAAGARARVELASRVLAEAGERGDVRVTTRRGHAREFAAAAASRGARFVVAWGGDGTVNEVASALAFSPTALAVVPAGSGNGLARSLRVARHPRRALLEACAAAPRAVDVGELGGRLFVNIAGVGFDAHVAACFDRRTSGWRGWSGYAQVTLRELLRYKAGTYRVDGRAPCRALMIAVANAAQYGNGAVIAPHARVDDGRLDLVLVEESSRIATLLAVPWLFSGAVGRVPGVSMQQVERTAIESDHPMAFHVDGEPVRGGTRLEARVHPGALRVCVR
jgi:YegS/Rv2252/BmrU family lipid kinase